MNLTCNLIRTILMQCNLNNHSYFVGYTKLVKNNHQGDTYEVNGSISKNAKDYPFSILSIHLYCY